MIEQFAQANGQALVSDEMASELLAALQQNADGCPGYIKELMQTAETVGAQSDVAYAVLTLWASGQWEFNPGNAWDGIKPGWQFAEVN